MIEVDGIDVFYDRIHALKGVSLSVLDREIVALIGANGAGKSTMIRAVAGLIPKQAGRVQFAGENITRLGAAEIVRRGLAVVPEGRRVFGPMSVLDNLRLGAYVPLTRGRRAEVNAELEAVFDLFPRLRERQRQAAGTLSGGEQQMLAIGRALMARPLALLMDEPSIGLAPVIAREIFHMIRRLRDRGITVLLVEQNARMSLRVADRAYVLEVGRITLAGRASDLLDSDVVRQRYLAV